MLECLLDPRSIAVLGASNDPKKVGNAVFKNLMSYQGALYPINPNSSEILGFKSFPRVSDIGEEIDLVVVAIPARHVPDALRDCSKSGVRAAIILSAGFRESSPEGAVLEEEIKTICSEGSIRVLGPNCLGIINTENNLNATFAGGSLPKGNVAFFSQSGALGIAVLDWAMGKGIGFSKFISLGNKADLSEIDFIEFFKEDPQTDVIIGYIEDVSDGKRFFEISKKTTKTKPLILIKSGGTKAGARAASSHTGALAGSETAFGAVFKQTGTIRANNIEELFELAMSFSAKRVPKGNRLLIITNAGGPGIMAADTAENLGVELPILSSGSVEALKAGLPPNASVYNPIDLIGDATSARYRTALDISIKEPNVDGIIIILTPQAMTDVDVIAKEVISVKEKTEKVIITSFMGEAKVRDAIEEMKTKGIYNFSYPEKAVFTFKRLYDYGYWRYLPEDTPLRGSFNIEMAGSILEGKPSGQRLSEGDTFNLLSIYGFRFPKRALARTSEEAVKIASEIGFPVVMKVSSPDIVHKTDVGGVRLGIRSKEEAKDAFFEITSNVRRLMPNAFIEGVNIYETAPSGKEVILGVTHDRTFGHMLMFGLGGIYVEVLKDVSFKVVPITKRDALQMIDKLKGSALLKGARGERPVSMELIVDSLLALNSLVCDFPEISELDINPLVVGEDMAIALDARIVIGQKGNLKEAI